MQTRFLHFADCHLGYWQYNSRDRYNDFARAFFSIIDTAVAEEVDFVILAGDLFQKRAIDALTLNQAMRGLERLAAANIPCIAVEGNHERAYFQEHIGWMEFLALRELLILLTPEFSEGAVRLKPYTSRHGAYFDPVPGVRVYGLGYCGASTARAVESYAEALAAAPSDGVEYTIFVAHAGVEGVLANQAGGLSVRQWSVLRPHVDYLALGHIHKPFDFDDWIYNPGSPETCSVAEAAWPERGYYLVDVNTKQTEGPKHQARLCANPRRPFLRLTVKADLHTTPEALMDHCQELLARKARDLTPGSPQPVVEFLLTGVLPFDHAALDLARLESMVHETLSPLKVLLRNTTRGAEYGVAPTEGLGRAELERQVLAGLLNRDARFQPQSEAWAGLAVSLKQLALDGVDPDVLLDELDHRVRLLDTMAAESPAAEPSPKDPSPEGQAADTPDPA
ncbi:MAG: DNA repair protein [Litorilinea sp.]|nr:MAG: DNA repair protein [Litorilinea sp.]